MDLFVGIKRLINGKNNTKQTDLEVINRINQHKLETNKDIRADPHMLNVLEPKIKKWSLDKYVTGHDDGIGNIQCTLKFNELMTNEVTSFIKRKPVIKKYK